MKDSIKAIQQQFQDGRKFGSELGYTQEHVEMLKEAASKSSEGIWASGTTSTMKIEHPE